MGLIEKPQPLKVTFEIDVVQNKKKYEQKLGDKRRTIGRYKLQCLYANPDKSSGIEC